jgi:protein transport protein SEC61 subunit gamma-like protein
MDVAEYAVKPVKEFAKDSYRLVKRCTKPDRKGAQPAGAGEPRGLSAGS